MQEMWVPSLGCKDLLEEEMATHSSILAWEIPWTEEPGGLQSIGSQRVRHSLVTKQQVLLVAFGIFLLWHMDSLVWHLGSGAHGLSSCRVQA